MRRPSSSLRSITGLELAKRLVAFSKDPEKRVAFFLGAGCSVTSGIPSAGQLVRSKDAPTDWLRELRRLRHSKSAGDDLDEWARKELSRWDPEKPAESYGELIERLFLHDGDRQREIERLCDDTDKVFPGFGYAVLASLMSGTPDNGGQYNVNGGQFNVVLTTNFDDLLVDAFFFFGKTRPLVIQHDSLAPFIRPTRIRPLIVKLHGDFQLSPRNREVETESLNRTVRDRVSVVLHDRALVVMGYGGADESIIEMLEALPDESLPFGVYWVSDEEPRGIFRSWIEKREAVWVEHFDFDSIMLLIKAEFGLADPDQIRFRRVHERYTEKKRELSNHIRSSGDSKERETLERALVLDATTAYKTASKNPQEASERFERLYAQYPDDPRVVGAYANFMTDVREDHDRAEKLYAKAIEADPSHAINLGNFARFMENARKDHDRAEELYEKAIEADPTHAISLGNFALFMENVRKDHDRAEELYEKAIEADPTNANSLGNFAYFMTHVRKDHDRAEELYEKAIEADPTHAISLGNFALFMENVRKDQDRAEEL